MFVYLYLKMYMYFYSVQLEKSEIIHAFQFITSVIHKLCGLTVFSAIILRMLHMYPTFVIGLIFFTKEIVC